MSNERLTIEVGEGWLAGTIEEAAASNRSAQSYRDLKYIAAPQLAEQLGGPCDPETLITDEEIKAIGGCETYAKLRMTCDALKHRRGGMYPPDWYKRIYTTDLYAVVMDRIGKEANGNFNNDVSKILAKMGVK